MTTLSDVADMLRNARREAGLSQEELARRAGVARAVALALVCSGGNLRLFG